jgi:hypothetical protein
MSSVESVFEKRGKLKKETAEETETRTMRASGEG